MNDFAPTANFDIDKACNRFVEGIGRRSDQAEQVKEGRRTKPIHPNFGRGLLLPVAQHAATSFTC
ncbi:hypothetical protein [Bifidobacterium bohemicum]|uniref:hypothetical protein n=1 Tax=Bifidobacterium bohemicum TaxID=638617 RepID=UPI000529CD5E|nr:hypothetical protein [Bifidobacterium bohemicum]